MTGEDSHKEAKVLVRLEARFEVALSEYKNRHTTHYVVPFGPCLWSLNFPLFR